MTAHGQEGQGGTPPLPPTGQTTASTWSVEQPLVPEGVFAVPLAPALEIGQVRDQAQAESMLDAIGIEPENGWIADYPITPTIVAENEKSMVAAAEAEELEMGNEEAQKTVGILAAKFGLNIQGGIPPPAMASRQQSSPSASVEFLFQISKIIGKDTGYQKMEL